MASTIGMVDTIGQPDKAVLSSIQCLHCNTRRVRHWILLRLVRGPGQTKGEQEAAFQSRGLQTTMKRLVDDHMVAQFARRSV